MFSSKISSVRCLSPTVFIVQIPKIPSFFQYFASILLVLYGLNTHTQYVRRANLKTGVWRKQSTSNFLENEHFLPPNTHTFLFFEEFDVLCFLETPVLRFALLLYLLQLPLNLSFKACKNFLEKISISFSIFLQMHTFFYSFFSTNVLIIADENTHAFDGISFFSLILCFFQSSSSIFFY